MQRDMYTIVVISYKVHKLDPATSFLQASMFSDSDSEQRLNSNVVSSDRLRKDSNHQINAFPAVEIKVKFTVEIQYNIQRHTLDLMSYQHIQLSGRRRALIVS